MIVCQSDQDCDRDQMCRDYNGDGTSWCVDKPPFPKGDPKRVALGGRGRGKRGGYGDGLTSSPLIGPPQMEWLIHMRKCIPNSFGQPWTQQVAPVYGTIDGQRPTNSDIGKRIVYAHDPLEAVHIVKMIQPINPAVGSVPTPFVTTINPCGGGSTQPRYITMQICNQHPSSVYGGCPHGGYSGCFRVDGREPRQSDVGKTVLYTGAFSQGNNPSFPSTPSSGCFMRITNVTGVCTSAPIVENVNITHHSGSPNNPCGAPTVYGCTDPQATNFNPMATVDNNSCTYAPRPTPDGPSYQMRTAGPRTPQWYDIYMRKGRGLSDNKLSRYKSLRG